MKNESFMFVCVFVVSLSLICNNQIYSNLLKTMLIQFFLEIKFRRLLIYKIKKERKIIKINWN